MSVIWSGQSGAPYDYTYRADERSDDCNPACAYRRRIHSRLTSARSARKAIAIAIAGVVYVTIRAVSAFLRVSQLPLLVAMSAATPTSARGAGITAMTQFPRRPTVR